MSLILEALRKSEAERRRGELPSLHAELPPVSPPMPPRGRPIPAWLMPGGATALLLIIVLTWWMQRGPGQTRDTAPAIADTPTHSPAAPPSTQATSATGSAAAPSAAAAMQRDDPTPTSSADLGPPPAPDVAVAARVADKSASGNMDPAPTEAAPPSRREPAISTTVAAKAATTAHAPRNDNGADASAAASKPGGKAKPSDNDTANVLRQIEQEARALQRESTAASPGGSAPEAPNHRASAPAAPPPSARNVLTLGDLDSGTRASLPALKISMHMWNQDPRRRFAIIDGQRVGEGDRIAGMTVTQIKSDAVLLEWQGQALRLSVR